MRNPKQKSIHCHPIADDNSIIREDVVFLSCTIFHIHSIQVKLVGRVRRSCSLLNIGHGRTFVFHAQFFYGGYYVFFALSYAKDTYVFYSRIVTYPHFITKNQIAPLSVNKTNKGIFYAFLPCYY